MCVADGSVDQFTSTCPMCKVYPPSRPQCPHRREICRNRANHPRHDVVYIVNAEAQIFNGCGYCKWARSNPPANKSGFYNLGWPGCCRPPLISECQMVPPADWMAVNIVHKVPIPLDVRQVLDAAMKLHASIRSPIVTERKTISRVNTSPTTPRSSVAMTIPQRSRTGSGGSPKSKSSSLVGTTTSRLPSGASPGTYTPSSGNPLSTSEQSGRRPGSAGSADKPVKRVEGFKTTPPSSVRKLSATEGTDGNVTIAHPPVSRPSVTAASLAVALASPASGEPATESPLKRRGSVTSTHSAPSGGATNKVTSTPKSSAKPLEQLISKPDDAYINTEKIEKSMKTVTIVTPPVTPSTPTAPLVGSDAISDNGSRSSGGSLNDGSTVTSDGAFTDYLSDESEAELQRQAEARAAVAEQNRMEEMEFRAAREQLASIDLRPPQAWTTGIAVTRKAINTATVGGR